MGKVFVRKVAFALLAGGLCYTQTNGAPLATGGSATGLSSPTNTVTFSEETPADATVPITTLFQPEGVIFPAYPVVKTQARGVFYDPVGADVAPADNINGANIGNFRGGIGTTNPISIQFVDPITGLPRVVTDAAFSVFTGATKTTTITSFLAGVQQETYSGTTGSTPSDFFGFTGSLFDEIQVTTVGGDNANIIDNLQFNVAVPEPTTVALLGFGGLSCLFRRRRI